MTGRVSIAAAAACVCALALAAMPARMRAQTPSTPAPTTAEFVSNELIVRLTDGGSAAKLAALFVKVGAVDVKGFETIDGLYVIKLPPALGVTSAAQLAKQLDGVAYAEPNYVVRTQVAPNDPSFGDLWGLHNTGQSGGTLGADIHAPEAWNLTTGKHRRRCRYRHRHRIMTATRATTTTTARIRPARSALSGTTASAWSA